MREGTVVSYEDLTGRGVIVASDKSHSATFNHDNLYTSGIRAIFPGDRVEYELRQHEELQVLTAHCLKVVRSGPLSISASRKKLQKKFKAGEETY